jgi:predicted nucleotidyltransferase
VIKKNEILEAIRQRPAFEQHYEELDSKSSEIVLFGSYAQGLQEDISDVDILFIGQGKSFKNEYFDFICISERKVTLKSWLGSELANHVAYYGLWLKGDGSWKHNVFVSQTSIERKKLLILQRLSHLWVKHKSLQDNALYQSFRSIQLDALRLALMIEGKAVPPTALLRIEIDDKKVDSLSLLCKERLLGKIGRTYMDALLDKLDLSRLNFTN